MVEVKKQITVIPSKPGWGSYHLSDGEGVITNFVYMVAGFDNISSDDVIKHGYQIGRILPRGTRFHSGKPVENLIYPPKLVNLLRQLEQEGFKVEKDVWHLIQAARR